MSLEVTGKLIVKYDTAQVSDKFKKREFVLELAEEINGNIYTNYAKMQLVQNKCEIIDRYNTGDIVKVSFNIKGTRYEKDGKVNYFSNLDAWRVEPANAGAPAGSNNQPAPQYNNNNNNNYNNNNNNYNSGATNYSQQGGQQAVDDLPF